MSDNFKNILSLDVGDKRIGIAICSTASLLPSALMTIDATSSPIEVINAVVKKEDIKLIVVGIPRNLSGQNTPQTDKVLKFVSGLKDRIKIQVYLQDEALTSVKAEEFLDKKRDKYKKADIDQLAAVYILEDFISENKKILYK
jgi:putative Holliday junction resolvase